MRLLSITLIANIIALISATASFSASTFIPQDFSKEFRISSGNNNKYELLVDFDYQVFEGYISFTIDAVDLAYQQLLILDGNGSEWTIDRKGLTSFKRLKMPVKILGKNDRFDRDAYIKLGFTKIFLEFTKEPFFQTKVNGLFGFTQENINKFSAWLFKTADIEVKTQFFSISRLALIATG